MKKIIEAYIQRIRAIREQVDLPSPSPRGSWYQLKRSLASSGSSNDPKYPHLQLPFHWIQALVRTLKKEYRIGEANIHRYLGFLNWAQRRYRNILNADCILTWFKNFANKRTFTNRFITKDVEARKLLEAIEEYNKTVSDDKKISPDPEDLWLLAIAAAETASAAAHVEAGVSDEEETISLEQAAEEEEEKITREEEAEELETDPLAFAYRKGVERARED